MPIRSLQAPSREKYTAPARSRFGLAVCLMVAAGCATGQAPSTSVTTPAPPSPDHEKQFPLWSKPAPAAKGEATKDVPSIAVYLPPADRATGAAVVVNPGGGYWVLAADHEGLQVARWLNRNGIAAFVLRYRVQPDYEPEVALTDGKRAMRWVRSRAKSYGISPNRIGMMGFSAGGNLASAVGTDPEPGAAAGQPEYEDEVERQPSQPNFLMLIYPAISHQVAEKQSFGRSTERFVSEDTPPTFLVHTHEDSLTPAHSLRFYEQLLELKVPAEMHIFGYGPHGTGIASGDPDLGKWRDLAIRWLRRSGFLADGTRVPVEGTVMVNGKPLGHGWLTLHPQDERQPIVAAYVGKKDGKFVIDAKHGPYPGRYRVEAHVLSTPASDMKIGKTSLEDAVVAAGAENGSPKANAPAAGDGALWIDVSATPQPFHLRLKVTEGELP